MGTDRKAFHLRWNNHMENMRSLFETSYCDQALVDVTVSCPDGKLKAHKLVLSACSPYFESVFKENPCKHPVLIMKGISYKEMSCLLEYMYKGEVDVLETDLQSLINTASDLQIRGLGYGYQTETTVAAAKASPIPLRNSPGHAKAMKTGDMAPVATPKSQMQVVAKVPESAATALNQDYDNMNSSVDAESLAGTSPRHRGQKRAGGKPPFDAVRLKKECDNFYGARQLVTGPKAPTSNPILQPGLCSPSLPTNSPSSQSTSASCGTPITLTVPTVGMLSGVMAARNNGSPPLTNKYGSTTNGGLNSTAEATNLSVNRRNVDEPTDLTSASNGFGNSEDEDRREMDEEEPDDDDENELHIDTSKMELSIKEEMEEDDDTIGYLCESTFTEGETTNGLTEKTEGKEGTEENVYEKEGTVCPFCFRDCKTTDALKRHVRIHTSQKPHQCEYCQLAFARSSHLERHRRTHTGERPFVCPIASCSKRFARQDKVKQHVIRHHTGLPRPVRQSSPKTYKPRATPIPIQPGGKRPRGRPRKHPSPEDFLGHLYHGHTLLDEGSQHSLSGQTPLVSLALVENMSDPLTCPPAKDFANISARNSPADFLQRDADNCADTHPATENLSTLELSVSTQEHIQGLKQIGQCTVEPVANPQDNIADTASVGT